MPENKTSQFAAELNVLRDAVAEAGDLAASMFKSGVETWDKSDKTPITEADLAVNDLLHDRLTKARPDYGWLSEETADDELRLGRQRTWVVDPIDGTRGFVRGTDQWCVCAGLVENGVAIAGVIAQPLARQFYEASSGAGAFVNGQPIHTLNDDCIAGCHIIMHDDLRRSKKWHAPWPELKVSMSTSMALRLCNVAAGQADATIAISGKSDWDLAAADILVHEAGGKVTGLSGNHLVYNQPSTRHHGVVAAGEKMHSALLERTRNWKKDI